MKRALWTLPGLIALFSLSAGTASANNGFVGQPNFANDVFPTNFTIHGHSPDGGTSGTQCIVTLNGGPEVALPCPGPSGTFTFTFDHSQYPEITPNTQIHFHLFFRTSAADTSSDPFDFTFWTRPSAAGAVVAQQNTCSTVTVTTYNQDPGTGLQNPGGTRFQTTVDAPSAYARTQLGVMPDLPANQSIALDFNGLPNPQLGVYTATATVVAHPGPAVSAGNDLGGPDSDPFIVSFTMRCNPIPDIFSLSPPSQIMGSPPFALTITGQNFITGASVLFNGAAVAGQVAPDGKTITATIPPTFVNYVGSATVTVQNPQPTDGPASPPLLFQITPPPHPIALDINVDVDFKRPADFDLIGQPGLPGLTLAFTYLTDTLPLDGTVNVNPTTGASRYQTTTPNFVGNDTFTYHVNDGYSDSNIAHVFLHVHPPNPPVADPIDVATVMNTSATFMLSGSSYGFTLSYIEQTSPAHGQIVAVAAGGQQLTYLPNPFFTGLDSFTYQSTDPLGQTSNTGVVTITVSTPVPTADDISVTVPFNTSKQITLSGSPGLAGLSLAFSTLTLPAHGAITSLSPDGKALLYTPNQNYVGPDQFTYKTFNGYLYGNTASVFVTVLQSTTLPKAFPVTVTTPFNTTVTVPLNVQNPSGLPLTYSLTNPANGVVTGIAPNLAYTPNPGFIGADGFTYQPTAGGTLVGNQAPVTINVLPPPVAPDPPPHLDSLDPPNARAGAAGFPLAVKGNHFALGALISWNGSSRTAVGTDTNLTASILDVDLGASTSSSTVMVQVINPDGQASNSLPFTILPAAPTGAADSIVVQPDGKLIYATDALQFSAQYIHNGSVVPGVTFDWDLNGSNMGTLSASGRFAPSASLSTNQMFKVTAKAYGVNGFAHVTVVPVGASLSGSICQAIAYPVPYKSTMNVPGITFTQLAAGAEIAIFTPNARPVRTLTSVDGGNVMWNLRNDEGGHVASGVYFYTIKQASGLCSRIRGKLVVIQ